MPRWIDSIYRIITDVSIPVPRQWIPLLRHNRIRERESACLDALSRERLQATVDRAESRVLVKNIN